MARFYGFAARFCTCLGVALLLCSIALVPAGGLFADDGGGFGILAVCPTTCNDTCSGRPTGECSQVTPGCQETTKDGCEDCYCDLNAGGTACKCKP